MIQRIIRAYPPNFQAIKRVLPGASGPMVIFSYGDTVYNPGGQMIPPAILAHEATHGERQIARGVEKWWTEYLRNPAFRFEEEKLGHIAEWRRFKDGPPTPGRHAQDRMLQYIANRLSGWLYGNVVSFDDAVKLLRA